MADSNYDALKTKTEKENYDRLLSLFRTGTEIKQWLLDYYISTKCRKELNLLDWLSIQSNNFLQFEDVKRAHRISSTVKSTDLGDNTINTVFMCYCFDIFWDCCLLDTSLEAFLNIHKDELYRNYVNSQKESALPSSPSERYGTSSPENNITKDQWEFLFKNEENEKSISASNGIAVSCLDRYQNLFILNIVCALFKSVKVVSECQIQISKIAALQCKSTKIEFDEMWDKLEAHILTIGEKCSFNCFFQRKCTEIKQTVFNRSLVQENRKYILQEALNNPTFIRDRDFCNSVRKELDMITVEENLNLARKLCGRDISVTLIDGEYRAGSYSSSVIENAGNDLQKLTSLNSYKDTYLYQRETEGEIQRDDMQEGINKHYYLKLVQLITNIGKNVLVDVLKGRLPGTNFGYAFNGMKNRILPLLNCQACQVLFPDNSYYKGDLSDLDISLMYLILRNLNTICPHKTGWGNMPEDDDRDMSANIERIRIFKNSYVSHHPKCSVNVEDFQKTWTEIRACIIELGGSEYTRRIDCLFTSEINPVIERELFNTLAQAKEAKRHDEINMLHLKAILDEIKLQLHEITRNRGTSTESSGMVSLELKLEGENIPLIREIEKLLNKLSPKYVLIKSLQEGSIIMCLDISSSAFHSLGYFLEVIESLLCIVLQRQLLSDDGITTHLIISLDFMDKNNEPLVYRQPSFDMVEGMKKWYEEEDKTGL